MHKPMKTVWKFHPTDERNRKMHGVMIGMTVVNMMMNHGTICILFL